jgi:alanine racemase
MREKLIDVFCAVLGADPDCRNEKAISLDRLVDELIANGVVVSKMETTTKWIPVTERLPDNNERVLVYHDDGMIRFGINKDGFADVVSTLYLKHNHRTCFSKVTHWMPLPEPPKGE